MNWTFVLKKLTYPSVQEEMTLIWYTLNIATKYLDVRKNIFYFCLSVQYS